nr:hypothetical protein [Tanacetum cinerariifolium]
MAVFDLNQLASSVSEEDYVAASNSHVVSVSSSINTGSSNSSKTPKAIIHHEFISTPDESVYWVPRVSTSVLPVLGTVYDNLDECIKIYRKYTSEARFDIRLSCQKRLKCGYVKQKYTVCNREGCPKEARVVFDMVVDTTKYILTTFDVERNHELDRVEYKDLFKAERKLTYNEQQFIIKAANANIGAVRALFSNFFQEFMSVKKSDKVKVKNPTGVKPKGCEKQKRIKSGREISMKKSVKKRNKKLNGCGVCGSTSHNRRTCPRKNDADVLYPAVVIPSGGDHVDGGLRDGASGSISV